ncbi:MAG TPA: hypothetical protein VMT53_03475 [Terriglobales bacterium]|nr:hypothetical protein [Terriglobales bacterium]
MNVQWNQVYVRLLDPKTGQLLREHFRQKRGAHAIPERDRFPRTPLRTQQLLWRADKAGANIGQRCHVLQDRQGEPAIRRILGRSQLGEEAGRGRRSDPTPTICVGVTNAE